MIPEDRKPDTPSKSTFYKSVKFLCKLKFSLQSIQQSGQGSISLLGILTAPD